MRSPLPVRCALRPSRIGLALIVLACAASAILLVSLDLPAVGYVVGYAVIVGSFIAGLRRMWQRVPHAIEVALDRRIAVAERGGTLRAGRILDDSYVGASFTTIVWRADGATWWESARTIVLLPDMVDGDAFRRLRIALRYGLPAASEGSSEREAG